MDTFLKKFCSFLITILSLNTIQLSAQNYIMRSANADQVDEFTYEFDILIKSTGSDFELTSYQCVFNFNWWSLELNGGEFTFSYIDGTSEISNVPSTGIGVNLVDYPYKHLTFASSPSSDIITAEEKRIGRFRLHKTTSFNGIDPDPNWNFNHKITTIITGKNFTNITKQENHINTIATDIKNSEENVVKEYQLHQNYPNPFNPTTTIRFNVKEPGKVKLNIYNILGEMTMEVLNQDLSSGTHEVSINAGNLASGIYIYKLEIENAFTDIKKMTLLK